MELWLTYGFEIHVNPNLMTFKVSRSPANTTADAFACFPEVWEVPKWPFLTNL